LDPQCEVHVVGWLDLSADERAGITDWLADYDYYYQPTNLFAKWDLYTASLDPQHRWHNDEQGRRLFRRFNCATFVMSAYEEGARVPLLDWDLNRLPEVNLDAIANVFGNPVRRTETRNKINLGGNGPWRIVLGGYLLHALNRPDQNIRETAHVVTESAQGEFPFAQSLP
jgi:hypothetical protein